MSQFVQLAIGGVIDHSMVDVPHDGARWDASPAPTCTLHHRNGGVIASSTAATVGLSFTVKEASAESRTISLVSTTGLERFGEYLLGPNANGQWEWVTVEAFEPEDDEDSYSVTVLDELQHSYSSDDPTTLKSHRLTLELSAAQSASVESGCFAAWAYMVDSVKRIEHTTFAISRYAPRMSLTPAEAISVSPRLRDLIGSDQRVEVVLRRLWRRHLMPDVAKILGSSGAVLSGESLEQAHLYKLGEQLAREAKDHESAANYSELYTSALDEIRTDVVDLDESGGQDDDETPRGLSTPRLLRG